MKKILVTAIVLVLLVPIAKFSIQEILEYQDREYAENYFRSMTFETVLESRRWNRETLGCTYAIVALDEAAPFDPPKQWLDGATWFQTPLEFKEEAKESRCHNLICQCENDWNSLHYQLLDRVLNEPGSFYYIGGREPPHDAIHQEVMFIYSQPKRVAAMVRFGD